VAGIGQGLLVLVGVGVDDDQRDAEYMGGKIAHLRIFEDEAGKMNLSVVETGGELLAVPNFTLYADTLRGRRPSFSRAAAPQQAEALFGKLCQELSRCGVMVKAGVFGAHMHVSLVNDGPVTLILESEAKLGRERRCETG